MTDTNRIDRLVKLRKQVQRYSDRYSSRLPRLEANRIGRYLQQLDAVIVSLGHYYTHMTVREYERHQARPYL